MTPLLRTIATIAVLVALIVVVSVVARSPRVQEASVKSVIPRLEKIGNAELTLRADAVFVKRIRDGSILYERNASERLPIASLTKLMTALILADQSEPLHPIVFSDAAKRVGAPDDKRSQVRAGDTIKAEDVLKLLLIASDNDAAYAVAEDIGGVGDESGLFQDRVFEFVRRMNARAGVLGLVDTHFSNPAGSDDPENFSTAKDLEALAEYILREHPELWSVSRTQETIVFGAGENRYGVVNTNSLLAEYPSLYGSKTGFDDEAKGTLLLLYAIGRDDLIAIVLLKSGDRFGDGRAVIQWIESNFRLVSVVDKDNR